MHERGNIPSNVTLESRVRRGPGEPHIMGSLRSGTQLDDLAQQQQQRMLSNPSEVMSLDLL